MIGAVPSAAVALVPNALRRMSTASTSWTMLTDLSAQLLDRVTSGELDIAVVTDAPPGLPKAAGVVTRHLLDDPMGVLVTQDHPLAGRRRVGIGDLADEYWLEDNPGSEALLQQLAARKGVALTVDRSSRDLMTKIALVAAGHGVALVPHSVAPALRSDVRLLTVIDQPMRGVYVVTRSGRDDLDDVVAALSFRAVARGCARGP